jgi:predicted MFS family arabinose efflux permease
MFVGFAATLAVTEPAERSFVGDHADREQRGTAFGFYHLANGLFVLPGAVAFGSIWQRFGPTAAFAASALVTAAAAALLLGLAARPSGPRGVARPQFGDNVHE